MKRVVITGIGLVAPNGEEKEEFWGNLMSGNVFVNEDEKMRQLGIKSNVNCKVTKFKEKDNLQARFIQFGITAGKAAVNDSKVNWKIENIDKCGVIFSSAIGGTPTIEKIYETLTNNGLDSVHYKNVGGYFYDAGMINYVSMYLAKEYGLNGICTAMSTGCTGGCDSLGMAFDEIRYGKCEVMITGATEAPLCDITYSTLDAIGALSVAKGKPSTRSRPFDATRAGFVISEGAGCLILEELQHAIDRGAYIYGEVVGYASRNNASHMTDLLGDGESMADTISECLLDANMDSNDVQYINAHGSSTKQNDLYETKAIKKVFGDYAKKIPISSTKSMIGHSLASASMFGIIASIGSILKQEVHPTKNLHIFDDECDLDYVPDKSRKHLINNVLITSSGFGGIHSAAIIRKYEVE